MSEARQAVANWNVFDKACYAPNSQGRKSLHTKTELDVTLFYSALTSTRKHKNMSWSDVWRRTGVARSTFTRMSKGGKPDVDALLTLCQWAALDPMMFRRSRS